MTMASLQPGLDLLATGWPIIPTYPAGTRWPDGRVLDHFKTPIGRDWGNKPCTRDRLVQALARYPDAGLGACLGPQRAPDGKWLVDLEVDGPGGEECIAQLFAGELLETPTFASDRGCHRMVTADGERLLALLRCAGAKEGKGRAAGAWKLPQFPGVEWRVGGYKSDGSAKQLHSCVPPTPGRNGPRSWLIGPTTPIAPLPESVYVALEDAAERAAIQDEAPLASGATEPVGRPRAARTRKPGCGYGAAAIASECDAIARTPEGDRHNRLRTAALLLGGRAKGGTLEWSDAEPALMEAARQCGLPQAEAMDVIRWAWEKALAKQTPEESESHRNVGHMALGIGLDCICPTDRGTAPEEPTAPSDRARARMDDIVPPADLADAELKRIAQALMALHDEAIRRGDPVFRCGYRLLEEFTGIPRMTVKRRMERLHELGHVSLIEAGIGGSKTPTGKANRWRWFNPPRPGQTVWKGATRKPKRREVPPC